jgi:hypothetical protein
VAGLQGRDWDIANPLYPVRWPMGGASSAAWVRSTSDTDAYRPASPLH